MISETLETDVLVIGGGIAGIRAAAEAANSGVTVMLTNKGHVGRDGAAVWMAGMGYQAALYPPDSLEVHVEDTVKGGKYLNNQKLVHDFLKLAPDSVNDLAKWGMRFGRKDGKFVQVQLPGETYPRSMCHTFSSQSLGGEYRKVLPRQVMNKKNIRVMNDLFIIDLLTCDDRVVGALGVDLRNSLFRVVKAKYTILATGGYMALFDFSTANPTLTGDGQGMAFRAGVRMVGMEFIQFFPAAAIWPRIVYRDHFPYTLLWRLRGIFYNSIGERFMERYYPVEKDFATREAMSRAIYREVKEGRGSPHGGAYVSFRHLPRNLINTFLEEMKDNPFMKALQEAGVDIREDAIEIGPAAHYVHGGCWINERCETNLKGLYAIGEVGAGGKDGADRLAGNALPFCMAMGYIAGKEVAREAANDAVPEIDMQQAEELCQEAQKPLNRKNGITAFDMKKKLQRLMSDAMIFDRNKKDLEQALSELTRMRNEEYGNLAVSNKSKTFNLEWMEALEARNMLDAAEMSMRAALMREESRGLHQRSDFPEPKSEWLKHILITKNGDHMDFTTEPVSFPYVKPNQEKGGTTK